MLSVQKDESIEYLNLPTERSAMVKAICKTGVLLHVFFVPQNRTTVKKSSTRTADQCLHHKADDDGTLAFGEEDNAVR